MQTFEEALALKEELDALRPLTKEQEDIIMQKFRLHWNYHSNSLERNSLTYEETKALLLHGNYTGNTLSKNKRIRILHGILSAFFVLLIGTVAGSTVGFIQEGLAAYNQHHHSLAESITDYYFKPLFWVFFFGFIPTLILGIVVGLFLQRHD